MQAGEADQSQFLRSRISIVAVAVTCSYIFEEAHVSSLSACARSRPRYSVTPKAEV